MVGLGAAPAVLQFGLLISLPETPRWLMKHGHTMSARIVLGKVYSGSTPLVEEVLQAIDREISEEDAAIKLISSSFREIGPWPWLGRLENACTELFRIGGNRRALTIACMLQGLQQLCGFVRASTTYVSAEKNSLTRLELLDVFLCHHLFLHRLLIPNSDIIISRDHQFHLHACCPSHYRSDRAAPHSALLYSCNGWGLTLVFCIISISRLTSNTARTSHYSGNSDPCCYGHLCLWVRRWSW